MLFQYPACGKGLSLLMAPSRIEKVLEAHRDYESAATRGGIKVVQPI